LSGSFQTDGQTRRDIRRLVSRQPSHPTAAVAAVVPGAHRLGAILAADETPSPEAVAAAGESTAMSVRAALLWALSAMTGLLAFVVTSGQIGFYARIWMPNSPIVLVAKARELLVELGHSEPPVDEASGFRLNVSALESAERRTTWPNKRSELRAMTPAPCIFWYRQDAFRLVSLNFGVALRRSCVGAFSA
jgi:hypothetical protein